MASNALSFGSAPARRYEAPGCNAAIDVVSTSTAATQTSEDDVNCSRLITAVDYHRSVPGDGSGRTVNAVHSPYSRGVESGHHHRLGAESPSQSVTAATSEHLTSLVQQQHQSRMTANGTCSGLRANQEDEATYVHSVAPHRVSTVSRVEAPSDGIMNLRNRPLKAATADDSSPGRAPTSTSIAAEKNGRRAGGRRRSTPFSSPSISEPSSPKRPSIRSFFPLTTIGSVCELFRSQISPNPLSHLSLQHDAHPELYHSSGNHIEPNLALLSIVVGIVEENLTNPKAITPEEDSLLLNADDEGALGKGVLGYNNNNNRNGSGGYSPAEGTPAPNVVSSNATLHLPIPTVHYDTVESLLNNFTIQIKESVDLSKYPKKTSRELIKKISDVVWSNLHRTYTKLDQAHLQTLYSYLNSSRLDAYGAAYTVVAACQVLGLDDVRLVMSEDHAWVLFGEGETCEVTWHDKSKQDKLGKPVPCNTDSWLYLNGHSMVCDRFATVATLVVAMNLSIKDTTHDSKELAFLQHQLLWILYDYGHLTRYPMALGNLADLEDICCPSIYGSSRFRKEPIALFQEAIQSAKLFYDDVHVYPYTFMGGYYFRLGRFKDAFNYWAQASQVMKKYKYSKDDEEIYKEFQEIANELIPNIIKHSSAKLLEPSTQPSRVPLVQDPECFASLLRFYDGLCSWEEDASTPVLHVGWTKPLVATISKFPHSTRSQVAIKVDYARDESDFDSDIEDDVSEDGTGRHHLSTIGERRRRRAASVSSNTHEEANNGEYGHSRHSNGLIRVGKRFLKQEKDADSTEQLVPMEAARMWKKPYAVHQEADLVDSGDEGKSALALLTSKKFVGLKNLLTAEKLNTSAIQLQLTAQSQVNVNKRSRSGASKGGQGSELDFVSTTTTTLTRTSTTAKRIRRD